MAKKIRIDITTYFDSIPYSVFIPEDVDPQKFLKDNIKNYSSAHIIGKVDDPTKKD